MSIGLGLLKCLLVTREDLAELVRAGITRDSFNGDHETAAYGQIHQHYKRYSQLPSIETVEADLGISFPDHPTETLDYWLDRVRERELERSLHTGVGELNELLKAGKLNDARELLLGLAKERAPRTEAIRSLQNLSNEVVNAHDIRQKTPGLSGISLGLPSLDRQSDGAQGGDSIAIVGRPGKGKTYLLCRMGLAAHWQNKRVLLATYEMDLLPIARRLYALATKVSSSALRFGRLDYFRRDAFVGSMFSEVPGRGINPDIPFTLVKGSFASTVEDLSLLVQQERPHAVFVDGAYLLRTVEKTATRTERVSLTAESLKSLGQQMSIPIISSYQFNRNAASKKGGGIENIYMTDVIGQLASIIIGIEDQSEDTDWSAQQMKELRILKGREGESGKILISYDMDHTSIEEVVSAQAEQEDLHVEYESEPEGMIRPPDNTPLQIDQILAANNG